jgi:glucose-6-phosphate 1-dehydrogenase
MLDTIPIRTPSAARLIECPPRREAKPADPCALVIFGATGDLTKRLVVPALYNLSRSKVLPEQFALIGVARSDGTAESWRERLYDMLKSFVGHAGAEFNTDHIDEDAWARLADKMAYISGDLTKPDLYENCAAPSTRLKKPTAPTATSSFISLSPIASSVPSWSNLAKPSSPIRART